MKMEEEKSSFASSSTDDDCVTYYDDDPDKHFDALKMNSSLLTNLLVSSSEPPFSVDKWIELGKHIGTNTHLKYLEIRMDGTDEDDLLRSSETSERFFAGLSSNRSLEKLILQDFIVGHTQLKILKPFFVYNDNLVDIFIDSAYDLPQEAASVMTDALRLRKKESPIKAVSISSCGVTDKSVPAITELAMVCPQLQILDLSFNQVKEGGCDAIAAYLQHPKCKLKKLDLQYNKISNAGIRIIAGSIQSNSRLKTLRVDGNETGGKETSVDVFANLLCDRSSINATCASNHTLQKVTGCDGFPSSKILERLLQVNQMENKIKSAREKIFMFHLEGEFDLAPFERMDLKVVVEVMGWLGKDCILRQRNMSAFYRLLRKFPRQCFGGYLEECELRTRKIEKLEQEVEDLKTSNKRLKCEE
mmetsp:Transcript_32331/g.47818  ORF Transcript_32331/g.47818 Transcript_32331/m.47818 type:complete len:417 (+) Transcript_32331:90-1340(+)